MKVLVADADRAVRRAIRALLGELEDLEVHEAGSLGGALALVESVGPDLLILDVHLSEESGDRGGVELLRSLRAAGRSTPAVLVTRSRDFGDLREAVRYGAIDSVPKDDLSAEALLPIIEGVRERAQPKDAGRPRVERPERPRATALLGSSPAMERVRWLISRVAESPCTVLIRGQTGSGKEMVARALHEASSRRDQPFLAVNCSALPGALIESLIFGHERGAFTGADRRARGQLELARGGTLLLDEIAEMPAELQAKLLRVLEDRRFRPLGAEAELPLRARILAATHVDLEARILERRFREDLYYRLNVVTIEVPSLAERGADIAELAESFASELPRRMRFTERALAWLTGHRWPGNVRELRNVVERVALLAEDELVDAPVLEDLARDRTPSDGSAEVERLAKALLALPTQGESKIERIERALLHQAIEMCGGNKSAAARLVGLDRKALERRWGRISEPARESEEPAEESNAVVRRLDSSRSGTSG